MIVELVGLPGCGKTTYLEKLHKRSTDIIDRKKLDKSRISTLSYMKFIFNNKSLFFVFGIGVLYNFEINLKRWLTLLLGVHSTFIQYAKIFEIKNQNNIVMDEGLLQRSLSVFYFNHRKLNPYLFKKVIKIISDSRYIDHIVFFNIEPILSIERCKKRESGLPYRYKKFDIETLKLKFRNAINGIEYIKNNSLIRFKQIN